MTRDDSSPTRRREFLKSVAVAGTAAGVATTAAGVMADDQPRAAAPAKAKGYRETDHVRTYYRLARN